jgi:hypothetical protein
VTIGSRMPWHDKRKHYIEHRRSPSIENTEIHEELQRNDGKRTCGGDKERRRRLARKCGDVCGSYMAWMKKTMARNASRRRRTRPPHCPRRWITHTRHCPCGRHARPNTYLGALRPTTCPHTCMHLLIRGGCLLGQRCQKTAAWPPRAPSSVTTTGIKCISG